MSKYEPVIGLEVHVQLATKSKMFCGCDAAVFDTEPNTHICPICTGQPGVLPILNQKTVEYAIMTGLALNCQIAQFSKFDRKNYHYPDLPKGYQISQYDLPISYAGWLMVDVNGRQKRIGIRRAHLEEDPGKLLHRGEYTLVDLNRSGVPLLEIVTEPDMRSAEEAYAYLTQLRTILRYLGVSTGDMEKGAMRCEPNISLRPAGSTKLGIRTEIKNLNSFRSVRSAIAYEIERQSQVLESGGRVQLVTMGWDEREQQTFVQRSKEGAEDYRYFPEPDIPPLAISREWVDEIRGRLPELPAAQKARLMADYALSAYDAGVLAAERPMADYFEAAVSAYQGKPKRISNWVSGELFRLMNDANLEIEEVRAPAAALAELVTLVDQGAINNRTARQVLDEMFRTGRTAGEIVQAKGLAQISDESALTAAVTRVLAENPEAAASYLAGKESILQWLMGQVMRLTRGQANPQLVLTLLKEHLTRKDTA